MAKKRALSDVISPYVLGYLAVLEKQGLSIEAAYVFGSWAKGSAHTWSDIDLCVVSPAFSSWDKKMQFFTQASYEDFDLIEAHGFTPKEFLSDNDPLVHEVLQYGVRVQ